MTTENIHWVDRTACAARVILIAVGLSAMAAVMYMSGRFGWSLQETTEDRFAIAALHVLSEAAAAGLVMFGALVSRRAGWRYKLMAALALACSLLLIAYSIISVNGFMSTRIAHLESHRALIELQKGHVDWMRKSAINSKIPKVDRSMMRREAAIATEELGKSLSFAPDAQAASIAAWFDSTTEKVQRLLVIVASCIGQFIKLTCLFFGFSLSDAASPVSRASSASDAASIAAQTKLRSRADADVSRRGTSSKAGADCFNMSASAQRMSHSELENYLSQHASKDERRISQRRMAAETGWSQSTVSRRLKKLFR
jgi:hypothetical protein